MKYFRVLPLLREHTQIEAEKTLLTASLVGRIIEAGKAVKISQRAR